MGRLSQGSRNAHIQASHGPDTNIMKFYITSNSTTYGKRFENFKPRQGRHTGTGYLSNFRPGVYYSQRLDNLDNPVMAEICSRNYQTVAQKHFKPYKENTGTEPLPFSVHQVGTGFIRDKPITHPTQKQIKSVFIDTRAASAPADVQPRGKPLLHKLNPKDPVELENTGYGPNYMSTETHERFNGKAADDGDLFPKTLGPHEETGFTHAYNIEPITFIPGKTFKNDKPGWMTGRPTGVSMMKTGFLPSEYSHGSEPVPNLSSGSERGTGFTREKAKPLYVHRVMGDAYDKAGDIPDLRLTRTRKTDPAEYINTQHPNNHSSIANETFLGQQHPDLTEAGRLARTKLGWHEPTGYCANNERYVHTADSSRRFVTHYMTRFTDNTPHGGDREGHCRGGIQGQLPDGFTKSTAVHSNGPDFDNTDTLRRLEPYVARSIKMRDPFFDDHLHDVKTHKIAA